MDNQDLERLILDDWLHEEIDTSSVDDKLLQKIKGKIDREVTPKVIVFPDSSLDTIGSSCLITSLCNTKFLLVS